MTEKNFAAAPKVSVIVPVYNAEKYLRDSVGSLLAQTFSDFEVLLVDDGSPDRSGEICDELAAGDSRIRVFHKVNGGVASARQMGLDNARGEYTIHADPDDWLEPDMLEKLYGKAKEENADIVICDIYMNYANGVQKVWHQGYSALDVDTVFLKICWEQQGSSCNKLIRRAAYSTRGIKFEPGIDLGEDFLFLMKLLLTNPKVAYLPQALYHYRREMDRDSYTNLLRMNNFNQLVYSLRWQYAHLDSERYGENLFVSSINVAFAGIRTEGMSSAAYGNYLKEFLPLRSFFRHRLSLKSLLVLGTKVGGLWVGKLANRLLYSFVYK